LSSCRCSLTNERPAHRAGRAGVVSGRSADQLRQALLRVLHDDAYHHRATALGQAMQAQPALQDVLDDLLTVGEAT